MLLAFRERSNWIKNVSIYNRKLQKLKLKIRRNGSIQKLRGQLTSPKKANSFPTAPSGVIVSGLLTIGRQTIYPLGYRPLLNSTLLYLVLKLVQLILSSRSRESETHSSWNKSSVCKLTAYSTCETKRHEI